MAPFGFILAVVLTIGSVVVLAATYFSWSVGRARGNAPFPMLARMLRERKSRR